MKCIKESIGHGVSSDSRYFISVENSENTTTVCNNLHSSGCLQFWNLLHFRCCLLKLLFYKSDADQELLSLCKGLLFKDAPNILGSIDSFYLYFIWVHLHMWGHLHFLGPSSFLKFHVVSVSISKIAIFQRTESHCTMKWDKITQKVYCCYQK